MKATSFSPSLCLPFLQQVDVEKWVCAFSTFSYINMSVHLTFLHISLIFIITWKAFFSLLLPSFSYAFCHSVEFVSLRGVDSMITHASGSTYPIELLLSCSVLFLLNPILLLIYGQSEIHDEGEFSPSDNCVCIHVVCTVPYVCTFKCIHAQFFSILSWSSAFCVLWVP